MSWRINDEEIASVCALTPCQRYEHFIGRVADWGEIWSLRDADGWVLWGNKALEELVPVWPHEEYAKKCAEGEWGGTQPTSIELEAWRKRWIPGMIQDGKKIVVFSTPESNGLVVTPEQLNNDLEKELARLED